MEQNEKANIRKEWCADTMDFKDSLIQSGIANQNDKIICDGNIHNTSSGLYQAVKNESGLMVGRWQKWREPNSYFDSWTNETERLGANHEASALQAKHFKEVEWQEYIDANQSAVLLSAWRSDSFVDDYAKSAWVIRKFVATGSTAWLYGKPDSKKTFTALDMACCVATGTPWCGRKVKQGPVLYISAEGGIDIHVRRKAWEVENGKDALQLKITNARPQLDEQEGAKSMRHEINEIKSLTGEAPALIIVDTYAQTSSDDTKNAVNNYTKNLTNTMQSHAPDAAIVVIDHTTKEGGSWMGSQAKLGNIDMMAMISSKDDISTITMKGDKGKLKGAPKIDDIKLRAKLVSIGVQDDEGEDITTLVMKDHAPMIGDAGEAALAFIGDGTTREEFRKWYASLPENEGGKDGTVRTAMNRLLARLIKEGVIEPVAKPDDSPVTPL